MSRTNSESQHTCENCGQYDPILDRCAVCLSVRSEKVRREGCPEWEKEK